MAINDGQDTKTTPSFSARLVEIELNNALNPIALKHAIEAARGDFPTGDLKFTVEVPLGSQGNLQSIEQRRQNIAYLQEAGFKFGGHICNEQNEIVATLMRKVVLNGQGLGSLPHNGKHPPAPTL